MAPFCFVTCKELQHGYTWRRSVQRKKKTALMEEKEVTLAGEAPEIRATLHLTAHWREVVGDEVGGSRGT